MLLFLSADSPVPKGRKVVVMLTLRKLKEMIESPKKGAKKPTPKSLREGKAPVIAQKVIKSDTNLVTITVYKNGYVVYEAMSRYFQSKIFPATAIHPWLEVVMDVTWMNPILKKRNGICVSFFMERIA